MKKYDFKKYEDEIGLIEFGEMIYNDFKKSKSDDIKDFLYDIQIINLPLSEVAVVFDIIINCNGGRCYIAYDGKANMLDRYFLGEKEELENETYTITNN